MDEQQKEELVACFRSYLDQEDEGGDEKSPEGEVDLFTLLTELAGLKSEVRLESRQFKAALDEFRGVFSALESSNRDLAARMGELVQQGDGQEEAYLRPMVLGLLEIHDRLLDALAQEEGAKEGGVCRFFCKGLVRRYHAHVEGLRMVLERVLSLLALCGVMPIEAMGRKFDPRMMKAVGFCRDSRLGPGVVCAQERTGFVWKDRLVRPAEVLVVKEERGSEDG